MAYTVTWSASAEQALTTLWLGSRSRSAITSASQRIDADLRNNPLAAGESREANRRIMFVDPLGVEFLVYENDRRILVFSVWECGRRG